MKIVIKADFLSFWDRMKIQAYANGLKTDTDEELEEALYSISREFGYLVQAVRLETCILAILHKIEIIYL